MLFDSLELLFELSVRMVHLVFTFLCLLAFGATSPLDEWNKFKEEYHKEYSGEEEGHRMRVFLENLKMIEEHNAKYLLGLESFSLGVNHLSDLETEEVNALFKGNTDPAEVFPIDEDIEQLFLGAQASLPDSVDWRTKGAVSEVKDQKNCVVCWLFAATGCLESHHFLKTREMVTLSEQDLLDCLAQGCNRGNPQRVYAFIAKRGGIDSEASYPYTASRGQCRYRADKVATKIKGFKALPFGDENALKAAVANVGPVSVSIDASQATFHHYTRGVFYDSRCVTKNLDHSVLVVGYGTENGQDYWLVKNSWGPNWGDNGYIKTARNRDNHCGIASYPVYPEL